MYLSIQNDVNYELSNLLRVTTHGQKYAQEALDRLLRLDATEFQQDLKEPLSPSTH